MITFPITGSALSEFPVYYNPDSNEFCTIQAANTIYQVSENADYRQLVEIDPCGNIVQEWSEMINLTEGDWG